MPQWAAFVGLTGFLLTVLLALARLSQRAMETDDAGGSPSTGTGVTGTAGTEVYPRFETAEVARRRRHLSEQLTPTDPSTGALLANVALTQGLFGAVLVGGAVLFAIPASALGITGASLSTGLPALAIGVAAGVGFWTGSELATLVADGFGVRFDESMRELLAPSSRAGWLVLLAVILPTIAVVEELLFRAAAIGVPVAGLGAPPWLMVPLAAGAFALGHGAQGRVGMVVSGTLGTALGALFVLTNSLLAVVVAHYLLNALELTLHEWVDIDRLRVSG